MRRRCARPTGVADTWPLRISPEHQLTCFVMRQLHSKVHAAVQPPIARYAISSNPWLVISFIPEDSSKSWMSLVLLSLDVYAFKNPSLLKNHHSSASSSGDYCMRQSTICVTQRASLVPLGEAGRGEGGEGGRALSSGLHIDGGHEHHLAIDQDLETSKIVLCLELAMLYEH
nr:hypothetical protein CFP56_09403 [Quercus suber]